MALKAQLIAVEQQGSAVTVTVRYYDEGAPAPGWETSQQHSFPNGATLTVAQVVAAVQAQGAVYKTTRANMVAVLAVHVNDIITIT